jgi:hypothetical protein
MILGSSSSSTDAHDAAAPSMATICPWSRYGDRACYEALRGLSSRLVTKLSLRDSLALAQNDTASHRCDGCKAAKRVAW